jgi:hypothetical protein
MKNANNVAISNVTNRVESQSILIFLSFVPKAVIGLTIEVSGGGETVRLGPPIKRGHLIFISPMLFLRWKHCLQTALSPCYLLYFRCLVKRLMKDQ